MPPPPDDAEGDAGATGVRRDPTTAEGHTESRSVCPSPLQGPAAAQRPAGPAFAYSCAGSGSIVSGFTGTCTSSR